MVLMKDSGIDWIPIIPDTWQIMPYKRLFKEMDRPVQENDDIITCFRDGEVTLRKNRRTEGFTMADKEIGYQHISQGDLVVHGMDGFAGSIGISDSDGKATPVLIVLNPLHDECSRYFMYLLRVYAQLEVFLATSSGIRVRSCALNWKKLGNLPAILPPIEEQKLIVDYIDKRCGEIDEVKQTLSDEIEALQRLRKATIHKAVTKGLDESAPMKDSGVEWIGEIPEDWCVEPLRQFFTERKHKNANGTEDNLLSLSYGRIIRKDIDSSDGLLPANFLGYNIVESGDIVFRMTDLQNDKKSLRSGLVGERGIITSAYVTVAPKRGVESRFHSYLQRAYDQLKVYYNMGSGVRQGINYDDLKRMPVLAPPFDEQQRIVDYLDKRCGEIDSIIETRTKQLERLEDYRKALVFAYVTGKKEVPVHE